MYYLYNRIICVSHCCDRHRRHCCSCCRHRCSCCRHRLSDHRNYGCLNCSLNDCLNLNLSDCLNLSCSLNGYLNLSLSDCLNLNVSRWCCLDGYSHPMSCPMLIHVLRCCCSPKCVPAVHDVDRCFLQKYVLSADDYRHRCAPVARDVDCYYRSLYV